MKLRILAYTASVATFFTPFVVSAVGFKDLLVSAGNIIFLLIPITASLALLAFFWGMAKFILHSGSEDAASEGKRMMIGGIVALFVLVSIWGIVRFIRTELGIPEVNDVIIGM
jgi:hypothetical protein